jgi:proteasome assembly chaperone (PAC2) family protein
VTFEHIIYIPGVLLVGLTVGYSLGARAVRAEMKRLQARLRR